MMKMNQAVEILRDWKQVSGSTFEFAAPPRDVMEALSLATTTLWCIGLPEQTFDAALMDSASDDERLAEAALNYLEVRSKYGSR